MLDAVADRGVLPAGTVVGNYRIESALAEGGMAMVYVATHLILSRRVALKVLHKDLQGNWGARDRLFQEARILEVLDHPGLVSIHDAGVLEDDRPWLAMELLEGVTLAQAILVHRAIALVEVCDLLGSVARALSVAHRQGIVHRDLKPENIIIVHRNGALHTKIVDWGIARIEGATGERLTRADMTPGTPPYMSPEQARGKGLDGRSDIYALGVIGFEALTGRLPFEGDCPIDIVVKHLTVPPPRLRDRCPDAPVALDELIAAMLAKLPEDRPSLDEIQLELAAIRGGEEEDGIPIELDLGVPLLSRPRWTPAGTPARQGAEPDPRGTR